MEHNQFGKFIESKRKKMDLSLRKMAMMLELSPAYVNDIEKGRRNPPGLDILTKIAEARCLTPTYRVIPVPDTNLSTFQRLFIA